MKTLRILSMASVCVAAAACGPRGATGSAGAIGPIGPTGIVPTAPSITSVSPRAGSTRNVVTILGDHFSSAAIDDDVRFGGVPATVTIASAGILVVTPPSGLALGEQPITVKIGSVSSAPAAFTLVESGTKIENVQPGLFSPQGALALADGRVLIADDQQIAVLDTAGVERALVRGPELALSTRMAIDPSGGVAVTGSEATWHVDTTTGALSLLREHGYSALAFDGSGKLWLGQNASIDLLDSTGVTASCITFAGGTAIQDMAVMGTDLWVITEQATAAAADLHRFALPVTCGAAVVSAQFDLGTLHGLAIDGAQLLVSGQIPAGSAEGLYHVSTAGAATPLAVTGILQGGGVTVKAGSPFLVDVITRGLLELTGGGLVARAGGVRGAANSLLAPGGNMFTAMENSTGTPGWILEIRPDGSTRVVTSGDYFQLALGDDPGHLYASFRPDEIREVDIATGATTLKFSTSGSRGLARDYVGAFYVSTPTGIEKRDATGGNPQSNWAAVPGGESLFTDGMVLYVPQEGNHTAQRITLSSAAVTPWVTNSVGINAPVAIWRDDDPAASRLYLADLSATHIYYMDAMGFPSEFGPPVNSPASISQRADGMLVVETADGQILVAP